MKLYCEIRLVVIMWPSVGAALSVAPRPSLCLSVRPVRTVPPISLNRKVIETSNLNWKHSAGQK